ncbi:MAG: DUF4065 domain-containing protein [Campylobacterota bacterium]|nr:DUF4065 domain-containing protein [Campylobacterota bacterium]
MKLNITKIANALLYMLDSKVTQLNDKKVAILLFLIDYNHLENSGDKIFDEVYIKNNRNPEPKTLTSIFHSIVNNEDLDDEDEKLYIIQELLDHLDIEILTKQQHTELKFVKIQEEFDDELFTKEEFKTIHKIVSQYKNQTPRKMANICFSIDKVRQTAKGEVII